MTALSIALVVIFVLYLIDKHNAWKGAAKIAGVLVALGALVVLGIYGWGKYEDWRAKKQHEASVAACVKSLAKGSVVVVRTGDEAVNAVKSFCESNPEANLVCGIKTGADGNLTTYAIGDTDTDHPGTVCTAKGWGQDPMLCSKWEAQHPLGSPLDFIEAEETNGKPVRGTLLPPEGCSGPLEDAYNAKAKQYGKAHSGK